MSNQLQLTLDFSEWTEADKMDAAQAAADIFSEYSANRTANNHINANSGSYEAELLRHPGSNFKGKD